MKKIKLVLAFLMLAGVSNSFGQNNEIQEDVTLIKKNLAASKVSITKYEWIETITTFVNGEQKSVKQYQCYYDVTGTLTKVATGGTTPPPSSPPGLRGKIAANQKADMTEYVERAVAKIKTYIPPSEDKIQQIYGAGKVAIQILEPGKKFKLNFPDYNQPGDLISISVDRANKLLMGYTVNTLVDDATDPASLDIKLSNLPDGTSYPGTITFNSAPKNLKIVISNSGFKLGAGK